MLKKEPKGPGQAPAMIVFCAFEQMHQNRHAFGFEVDKNFYKAAKEKMLSTIQLSFIAG